MFFSGHPEVKLLMSYIGAGGLLQMNKHVSVKELKGVT